MPKRPIGGLSVLVDLVYDHIPKHCVLIIVSFLHGRIINSLGKAPVFSLLSNPADNPSRPSSRHKPSKSKPSAPILAQSRALIWKK